MKMLCPTCHGAGEIVDPEHMEAPELRFIRGQVGLRLGYDGPQWQTHFAKRLRISSRSLHRYLNGLRDIPPLVARRARELRADPALVLTASERAKLGARRLQERRYWTRAAERQARQEQASKPGPDVPF